MINDKEMGAPTMLKSLARLVLENCRGTIISRAQKLRKVVNEFKKSQGTWGQANDLDIAFLRERRGSIKVEGTSWSDFLDDFLVEGLHPDLFAKTKSPKLLLLVYLFAKRSSLISALASPKLIRRFKKLADYLRAVEHIVMLVQRERGKRIFALDIVSF
jgi:hypothetical protein